MDYKIGIYVEKMKGMDLGIVLFRNKGDIALDIFKHNKNMGESVS